jgi:hypothetical protein
MGHYDLCPIISVIIFGINENCLMSRKDISVHQFSRTMKLAVAIIPAINFIKIIEYSCHKSVPHIRVSLLGIIKADFDVTD